MFKLISRSSVLKTQRQAICGSFSTQVRTKFSLPPLDYPLEDGVQPAFDGRQLDFHYNKHHQTYINNLNKMIAGTNFENMRLEEIIMKTQGDGAQVGLYNNAAQHFNHSFFWKCLRPNPQQQKNEPSPSFAKVIELHFGSVEEFRKQYTENALKLFGSGWTWLVMDPATNKLSIWNGSNAQCPIGYKLLPLHTIDVWEHAYYLVHQNRRNEYLAALIGGGGCINWAFVEENYRNASGQYAKK